VKLKFSSRNEFSLISVISIKKKQNSEVGDVRRNLGLLAQVVIEKVHE